MRRGKAKEKDEATAKEFDKKKRKDYDNLLVSLGPRQRDEQGHNREHEQA